MPLKPPQGMILLTDHLIAQLSAKDASFWVANVSKDLIPDLARANGVVVSADRNHITFFIPEIYSRVFLANCQPDTKISFLVAAIYTLESYQFKGTYIHHRFCTEEEETFQENYLNALAKVFYELQLNGDKFSTSFRQQPSIAYTMSIEEIFVQTPKQGTGGKLVLNSR